MAEVVTIFSVVIQHCVAVYTMEIILFFVGLSSQRSSGLS